MMAEKVVPRNYSPGLEGVVVAVSKLTSIDGLRGKLMYRGYNIHDLAEHATYEEVAYLLMNGELPTRAALEEFNAGLVANRELPAQVLDLLRLLPKDANPMAALRTAVSAIAFWDPEAETNTEEANRRKAVRLIARMATVVAAFDRIRNGKEPVAPQPHLSHAANFLYMLTGEEPSDTNARVFDIALVLHADHEMNASTFSARVTASSLSDFYSAITSAVGTLKGPLHGGANTEVMKLLLEVGSVENVEPAIRQKLANKEKIMGFGHRVYKTEDPRATVLRRISKELGERAGQPHWYEMSRKIEDLVKAEKGLNPNVDFYSASAYYVMGIPLDLYTPIFALSRIVGWSANVLEQLGNNRIFRPDTEYVGPSERPYVTFEKR